MTPDPKEIRVAKIRTEAEGYLELNLAEAALGALARLEDDTGEDPHCCFLQGEALRMLDRFDEAIEPLERAAQGMPNNIHIWLAMGWCYKRVDQIDLAIEALDRALEVEPLEALLHYNQACYWSLAGVKWKALKCLAQTFELDTEYVELIDEESDFDALRFDPDFQALCNRSGAKE